MIDFTGVFDRMKDHRERQARFNEKVHKALEVRAEERRQDRENQIRRESAEAAARIRAKYEKDLPPGEVERPIDRALRQLAKDLLK